jgi:hypothetical protein
MVPNVYIHDCIVVFLGMVMWMTVCTIYNTCIIIIPWKPKIDQPSCLQAAELLYGGK